MGALRSIDTGLRTLVGTMLISAALAWTSLRVIEHTLRGASLASINRLYLSFARLCMRLGGTQVVAHGLENLEPGQAYVIVANHESNWDPMVAVAALDPLTVRFVIKREVSRVPLFGRALLRSGNVSVARARTGTDVDKLRQGMEQRDPRVSILFYAEGTRSRDGSFRPFRKGAFATAILERLPILPIATAGTYPILTPKLLRLRKGTVVLEVGKPIAVTDLPFEARDELRGLTERVVRELRGQARRRLRELGFDPGGID